MHRSARVKTTPGNVHQNCFRNLCDYNRATISGVVSDTFCISTAEVFLVLSVQPEPNSGGGGVDCSNQTFLSRQPLIWTTLKPAPTVVDGRSLRVPNIYT